MYACTCNVYLFDVYTFGLADAYVYIGTYLYVRGGYIKHSETSFGERFPLGTVAVYKV